MNFLYFLHSPRDSTQRYIPFSLNPNCQVTLSWFKLNQRKPILILVEIRDSAADLIMLTGREGRGALGAMINENDKFWQFSLGAYNVIECSSSNWI